MHSGISNHHRLILTTEGIKKMLANPEEAGSHLMSAISDGYDTIDSLADRLLTGTLFLPGAIVASDRSQGQRYLRNCMQVLLNEKWVISGAPEVPVRQQ